MFCNPKWMTGCMLGVSLLAMVTLTHAGFASESSNNDETIMDLSLEDLLSVEVTSVSKRPQPLRDAAAAIYVITGEDMRRQGVTNIPDALRQVPGIHVARIDANKWAVTSRGYNGRFSNKLLVLIDGRSVYTPAFSGVYWEQEDVMLEDVDRIEIIRGPGSTLWGANAVNGVINIITKHAADTQGGLVVAGAGDVEQGFGAIRWGTKLSESTYARFYGKALSRNEFEFLNNQDAGDDWQMFRGGFRLDSQQNTAVSYTLQGDLYSGDINQQIGFSQLEPPYWVQAADEADVSGGNVLGRWVKTLSPSSDMSLQVYFNRAVRDEAIAYQATDQVDFDFQHHFVTKQHSVVWGLGYRHTNNDIQMRRVLMENVGTVDLDLYSTFLQDEISLWHDRASLVVGSKLEHNDYTGLEVQPSIRFIWRPQQQLRLWGAVSRAVRTPMRVEDNVVVLASTIPPGSPMNPGPLPVGLMVTGNSDFVSEELLTYELGYRFTLENASAGITAFYNDYTNLEHITPLEPEMRPQDNPPYISQTLLFDNKGKASDYGVEAALAWQAGNRMRWNLAYSFLRDDLEDTPSSQASSSNAPQNMLNLNCGLKPMATMDLNVALRYTDDCRTRQGTINEYYDIPSYTTMDARIGWHLMKDLEVSVVGQNLLDKNHLEYVSESFSIPTFVPRSYYAKIRWSF